MKLNLLILNETIKKNKYWLLFYFLILIIYLIILFLESEYVPITYNHFLELINYPDFKLLNGSYNLYYIYNYLFFLYLGFKFYYYDLDNSFNNIVIRIDKYKWLFSKLIIFIIFLIIFKLSTSLIIAKFLSYYVNINYGDIIISILYLVTMYLVLVTIINLFNKKIIIILLLVISSFVITFLLKLNLIYIIILSLLLIAFNFKIINLKKLIQ